MTIHDVYVETDERPSRRRRSRPRVWLVVLVLVVLPLAFLTAGGLWFMGQLDPPGAPGDELEVRVAGGWSVTRIGEELADRDVIGSPFVFSVYSRLNGQTDFQAGTYDLRQDMGVRDAVEALEAGPRIDYLELAVPPGKWILEVAELVGDVPERSEEEFLQATRNGSARSKYLPPGAPPNLEGLLWPDTYQVSETDDEIAILAEMVALFDERADALGLATATTEGRTPYEIITVASLIEAEAKVDADRPLIASVIYNRLRAEMPLQIDASLLYASGDPAKQSITEADQQAPGPFNTYVNVGLPPTPIGSVSEASLIAAMQPAQSEFLFYVIAGDDGHHAFAEDFDRHQENIEAARAAGLL
ncbi:MAG: endolytic transglycosylase MltG [Actinomycetota bacterium]|nr:endolytic transglycosylase MltG [Actinomycetota bacterium]